MLTTQLLDPSAYLDELVQEIKDSFDEGRLEVFSVSDVQDKNGVLTFEIDFLGRDEDKAVKMLDKKLKPFM